MCRKAGRMKEIDKKLIDILNIFEDCSKIPSCEECVAWKTIEGTATKWCEFLRERDKRIMDKLERVFCD